MEERCLNNLSHLGSKWIFCFYRRRGSESSRQPGRPSPCSPPRSRHRAPSPSSTLGSAGIGGLGKDNKRVPGRISSRREIPRTLYKGCSPSEDPVGRLSGGGSLDTGSQERIPLQHHRHDLQQLSMCWATKPREAAIRPSLVFVPVGYLTTDSTDWTCPTSFTGSY